MKVFHLHVQSFIPGTIDDVWNLAANPKRLVEFTPAYFGLFLKQESLIEEGGMIHMGLGVEKIPYQMDWIARIEKVQSQGSQRSFVDIQEVGPFSFWRHRHLFEECPGGVLVDDFVEYSLPLIKLAKAHSLLNVWVKGSLTLLFRERQNRLATYLRKHQGTPQLSENHVSS